jgi:hypothetical protein
MTMTNDDIVALCRTITQQGPTTIYFAIGCALGRYGPGEHPRQQYPPFMGGFPGRQICILMDPELESPPRAYEDLTGSSAVPDDPIVNIGDITFITARRYFEWNSDEARKCIGHLCDICLNTRTQLIVQDYAGNYIEQYYPIATFGPAITKKVLFDVTYRDGGCFIDLDAVRILRHRDGSFVQPKYDPIVMIRPHVSAAQFRYVLRERRNDITNYVRRFHRIIRGAEEVRDWCTEDIVKRHMQTLCYTYGVTPEPTLSNMEQLMSAYLFDLCTTVGDRVTEETAIGLIRSPTKEYDHMLAGLEEMILEEVVARENHHPV